MGLYYLNSRYYDSNTCRFINADKFVSTGQGLLGYNMFAYCNNNPIMYTDPSGESLLGLVLVAVVVYTFYILIADSIVSDIPSDVEASDALVKPQKSDSQMFYYDVNATEIGGETIGIDGEVGVYTKNIKINDYNFINIDVGKIETSIGYNGMSAGFQLGELSLKNNAAHIFNKRLSVTFSFNTGVGYEFSFGKKSSIGLSFLFGASLSIEVYE